MIQFLKPCIKEIQDFPEETREDLTDAIARLEEGHHLSFFVPSNAVDWQ